MDPNLESRVDRLERDLEKLVGVVNQLAGVVANLAEAQKHTDQQLQQIAEAQKRTDLLAQQLFESQKRTDEKMLETTEKLNALVQIVDDWIRNNPRPGA